MNLTVDDHSRTTASSPITSYSGDAIAFSFPGTVIARERCRTCHSWQRWQAHNVIRRRRTDRVLQSKRRRAAR